MPDQPDSQTELRKIDTALAAQEALRGILPDEQLEATLAPLRERRNVLLTQINEMNITSTGNIDVGGDMVGRDKVTTQTSTGDIVQSGGVKNVYQSLPGPKALPLPEALRRYLDNLIATHQHLRLQGIRAGGQPLSVDLEKVYVSLTAVEKRSLASHSGKAAEDEEDKGEAEFAQAGFQPLTIGQVLDRYSRLVIIGDPGSGKTTLLAYLALTYARALRDGLETVKERLKLEEQNHLPILLPLRDFGRHLKTQPVDSGQDGPALLLDYLHDYYAAQSISLPEDFFKQPLEERRAIVLLDGMDEVAETQLRQRVARIIEKFAVRYPGNRFVVTSREIGYEGAARVGAEFGLAKVREFSQEEVRRFVRDWTRVVEVKLAGYDSEDILRQATEQADKLSYAIEGNQRISALAINPLLLTVVALVHRYRAALPERRSELYEEAVEVLLGRWDEAKGLETEATLAGRPLDAGDRRSLLEPVALWLHEKQRREIELDELRPLLLPSFKGMAAGDAWMANKAVEAFLRLINERSGLLVERGVGVYGFAHLTFQEYLAARAVADRADALEYTLERLADAWWREVILLEAGYLSTQGKRRVSELIGMIMNANLEAEPEPYHHLILAVECLYDVGAARVEGDLLSEVKRRLQAELDQPLEKGNRELVLRRVAAANALNQIESGQFGTASKFWKAPWGEPEWVTVPAGEFWMGSEKGHENEKPVHHVFVTDFQIARVPITNAQYVLFVAEGKVVPPHDWRGGQPPKGKENHPVVNVSWYDAQAYCQWLSKKIGRTVRLPTEAEWEKAARGDQDQSEYPWGDAWEDLKCNSQELGLGDTSPVGLFRSGASPYGCLDIAGNVWEWCGTRWHQSYSELADETRKGNATQVLRGGSFNYSRGRSRCAYRGRSHPDLSYDYFGFRVVVSP
jgi:formylglycine-generating enzyme required for sulfatase activity